MQDVESSSSHQARRRDDLGVVDGLVQLSNLVHQVLVRTAAGFDMSVLQGRLLGVLRDREPTMAQLGNLMDLDKSSTTGLIDRAERRGLVRRAGVPEDGRSFRVVLTAEGRELAQAFTAEAGTQVRALTDGLTDTNRHRLALLATDIVQHHAATHGVELSAGISPPNRMRAGRPVKGSAP
jgi:DNA-binding MarR family transcriptional regulator